MINTVAYCKRLFTTLKEKVTENNSRVKYDKSTL